MGRTFFLMKESQSQSMVIIMIASDNYTTIRSWVLNLSSVEPFARFLIHGSNSNSDWTQSKSYQVIVISFFFPSSLLHFLLNCIYPSTH
jgi:hypothetical protein